MYDFELNCRRCQLKYNHNFVSVAQCIDRCSQRIFRNNKYTNFETTGQIVIFSEQELDKYRRPGKIYSTEHLNPFQLPNLTCTMLLLPNLAYPEWVSINCTEPILKHAVCYKENMKNSSTVIAYETSKSCGNMMILNRNKCFLFAWFKGRTFETENHICKSNYLTTKHLTSIVEFNFIFRATKYSSFCLHFFQKGSANVISIAFEKIWTIEKFVRISKQNELFGGYTVCQAEPAQHEVSFNTTFTCIDGSIIAQSSICDQIDNNKAVADNQKFCPCTNEVVEFCNIKCSGNFCICFPFHYRSHSGVCVSHTQPAASFNDNKSTIQCSDGTTIDFLLVNDGVPDCGPAAEDEPHMINLLVEKFYQKCAVSGQIPCRLGHTKCFNMTDICIFRKNKFGHLLPCRNGEHLEDCTKFECNFQYKCPGQYCVPLSHMCNGMWDCPNGEEEDNIHCVSNRSSSQLFKCSGSNICIHPREICNVQIDCPLEDDEQMCELKTTCPSVCTCFNYAMSCAKVPVVNKYLQCLPYISYHFYLTDLKEPGSIGAGDNTEYLYLANNRMEQICSLSTNLRKIKIIDGSYNDVESLTTECFRNLTSLASVNMSSNMLSTIQVHSFVFLGDIKSIDVSSNQILFLPKHFIFSITSLYQLILYGNPLIKITVDIFQNLNIAILSSENYRICCIVSPNTLCSVPPPWYSSCSRLFSDLKMRVFFNIISFTILLANTANLVSLWRILHERKQPFSVIVLCVSISDALCGLYLLVIWIADAFFGDTYIVNDSTWRKSFVCFVLFFLVSFFSLMVPYFLSVLTFARLMVIIYTFYSNFKQYSFVLKLIVAVTAIILFFPLLTTLNTSGKEIIPSSLCSPFIDHTNSLFEIKMATIVVSGAQFLSLFFILTGCFKIVWFLRTKDEVLKRKKKYTKIVVQLAIVTISNVICWVPFCTIYITALFTTSISFPTLKWNTILIVPINSLINPFVFLFTLQTERKRKSRSIVTFVTSPHSRILPFKRFVREVSF